MRSGSACIANRSLIILFISRAFGGHGAVAWQQAHVTQIAMCLLMAVSSSSSPHSISVSVSRFPETWTWHAMGCIKQFFAQVGHVLALGFVVGVIYDALASRRLVWATFLISGTQKQGMNSTLRSEILPG